MPTWLMLKVWTYQPQKIQSSHLKSGKLSRSFLIFVCPLGEKFPAWASHSWSRPTHPGTVGEYEYCLLLAITRVLGTLPVRVPYVKPLSLSFNLTTTELPKIATQLVCKKITTELQKITTELWTFWAFVKLISFCCWSLPQGINFLFIWIRNWGRTGVICG